MLTGRLPGLLAAVVAAAAGAACTNDDCPHNVIDRSTVVQITPAQACALAASPSTIAQSGDGGTGSACAQACGDSTITFCQLDPIFDSAYGAAQPADGGAVCPGAPDGGPTISLTCEVTHTEGTWTQGCPVEGTGRRPPALVPDESVHEGAIGAYLAQCAYLESASVLAFELLVSELRAHHAPRRLVDAARRAAREEVRHAELVGSLARRFGANPSDAKAPDHGVRPLRDIALENAVEGLVRETFGAAVALWRAEHAGDAEVRTAMREIARDECGHAELSWAIAAWAHRRLTSADREEIDRAVLSAIEELEASFANDPPQELRRVAGVPSAAQARELLRGLREQVWAVAA
jgi:hypothetical protein